MAAPFRIAFTFATPPKAIAAWGDRVWIVFAPSDQSDSAGEVWALRAVRNPAFETWFNDPVDRLELRPALPSRLALESFIADAAGPLALLRDAEGDCRLFRLDGDGWTPTETLPDSIADLGIASAGSSDAFHARHALSMVRSGSDGRSWVVVGPGDTPRTWLRVPRGGWMESAVALDGPVVALATVGETPVALLRDRAANGENGAALSESARSESARLSLFALRSGSPLRLGQIVEPVEPWTLLGLDDGLRLATIDAQGEPRLSRIDLRAPGESELLGPGGSMSERSQWVHVPVLGMLVVGSVMLAVMFCSDRIARTIALPEGTRPADLPLRALGVVIDYLPAAVVVWLATDCAVVDLITLPIWTAPLDRAVPPVIALLLSCLAAGLAESIFGTSPGKAICGVRVVDAHGRRPAAWRCLLRAIFKFFVLCLPLLGAFHLITAQRRGLPELVVDAVVVQR